MKMNALVTKYAADIFNKSPRRSVCFTTGITIVLTGSTGFVGIYLLGNLLEDRQV